MRAPQSVLGLLLALGLAGLVPACGSESGGAEPLALEATARSSDPRVRSARAALEWGRAGEARALVAQIGASAGIESFLLRARMAWLSGDLVSALAELESARLAWGGDGRIYATLAELYASDGRLDSAEQELRRGLAIAPRSPELERARGIVFLSQMGGATAGLEHLERALAADPDLPFTQRARFEGYQLLARQQLAAGDAGAAVRSARVARDLSPDDPEARETLAEACGAAQLYELSIELYEGLLAEGRPVRDTLAHQHKSAATACLLGASSASAEGLEAQGLELRSRAIDHWLRARDLGLPPELLGYGRDALAEAALQRVDAGIEVFQRGDFDGATQHFRSALRYDPECLEARSHLGSVLIRLGDSAGAVEAYAQVLADAERLGIQLPDPVHVNLALALKQEGRLEEARALLRDYLEREPEGEWAEVTRSALERL